MDIMIVLIKKKEKSKREIKFTIKYIFIKNLLLNIFFFKIYY